MSEIERTSLSRSSLWRCSRSCSSSYATSKWFSIAVLLRPVTSTSSSSPDATASSTTYWMVGLSTSGSISFGCALVAGMKRVPRPAAGKTPLRTVLAMMGSECGWSGFRLSADLDAELLHAVPQAPLRDAEDLRGAGLDAAALAEGVEDHLALPGLERLVERPREHRGGRRRRLRRRLLDGRREMSGEDHAVRHDHRALEHVLELAHVARP